MKIGIREAGLCLIRHENTFLVAELEDPGTGAVLHRPPGGGIEQGESPEQAVRRELLEELGVRLTTIRELGPIDHTWFWNGRAVRERAWIFSASSSDDPRLKRGENPDLIEASGQRFKTIWRLIQDDITALPPLCPSNLYNLLKSL